MRTSFLDALPESDRAALLEAGHRRRWSRGEFVVRAGEPAGAAIALLAGLVKVHRDTADGVEVVLSLSGPGDLLGEVAIVAGAVRSAHVTALQSVEASVIAVADLRRVLEHHPRASLGLLELALTRLHDADARRLEFATAESLGRVASRLVEVAERFGSPAADGVLEVSLPITQEELASWSASSRESTARSLRTLRELGLIETRRLGLRVLDPDGLRRHAARI